MEQLLKNWKLRMVKYRQEADNAKTPITQVKAMNKFFIYRDCIKELEEQLRIGGVVSTYCDNRTQEEKKMKRMWDEGETFR